MTKNTLSLRADYWDSFGFQSLDLEFLYNHLIDVETPQTSQELLFALVKERIRLEKLNLERQMGDQGNIYYPKDHHEVGEKLMFPSLDWREGKVVQIRKGSNPDVSAFEVITVQLNDKETREFAASLEDHILNTPIIIVFEDDLLDAEFVINFYGHKLINHLTQALETNQDLVRIAGRWFPRTLLVDVNIGYLNLAEALLDMSTGGPLPTSAILEQIELPYEANPKLTEFSLNLALQEDGRFDEVGPAGEVLWYLRRLEPDCVKSTPVFLQYKNDVIEERPHDELYAQFTSMVNDEMEPFEIPTTDISDATISLIYPHWRAGALPLAGSISRLFPTAYESPRILTTFVDGDSKTTFPGWVVREAKYVYGLENWFKTQGIIPGSYIHVIRGKNPGEVIIKAEKKRASREWIRTALVGADSIVVFAMIKQLISTVYDERMAVFIPNIEPLDQIWKQINKQKPSLEHIVIKTMHELAKLNPQGHVHAQELYAAVNIFRRCPPGSILTSLFSSPKASYLGDLYFRLSETQEQ